MYILHTYNQGAQPRGERDIIRHPLTPGDNMNANAFLFTFALLEVIRVQSKISGHSPTCIILHFASFQFNVLTSYL